MKKINFNKVRLALFLTLLIFISTVEKSSSQTMCTKAGTDRYAGIQDGYRYELWNQNGQGTGCMTLGEGALFSGEWSNVENYLARRGLGYNETQEHGDIGNFYSVFDCNYKPSSASGNSYLSIYGWTVDPLIEFYIVEDWRNWIPSMSGTAVKKGTVTLNGSVYDIIENTRVNQPSIKENTTFQQYFSIRRDERNNGTIDITEHFLAWEALGMELGKMYEVSFVVEGYQSSGSFEFNTLEILVEDNHVSKVDISEKKPVVIIHSEPTSKIVSIEIGKLEENARMKIYNTEGKIVFSQDNVHITNYQVSNLKNGIYLLNVFNQEINYSTKFVVY